MQLKQLGVTLALAGMLSTQAYAHEAVSEAALLTAAPVQAAPANVLTQDDLVALFGAEEAQKPLQLAVLSQQEMRETEGAAIWFAPVAWAGARYALTGFTRHGLNQVISRGGVGVSNQAILSTLRNPITAYSNIANKTTRYVGKDATVVLNQDGRLVTAWGRPR